MPFLQRPISHVGFACITGDGELSTNHTFRLSTLSPESLTVSAHRNLEDMERILFRMAAGPLRLFRIGSSLVPFASHDAVTFDWRPAVAARLRTIGDRYLPLGFRFSMHPGQYTVLNSPTSDVVRRAVAEIDYATTVLDLMGLDQSHKVVIHGGGIYGNRDSSSKRLVQALSELPERLRARLVIENDERYFTLEQILGIAEEVNLPVVFDLHHHRINPGGGSLTELLYRVKATWAVKPKVHLSSQRAAARIGAHDDLLKEADLIDLCEVLPFEADLMVEAKSKDVAAIRAWQWLEANGKISL